MSLKRKTPLRRTGGLRRTGRLPSRGPSAKTTAKRERSFGAKGGEADRVRAMPCVCNEGLRNELQAAGDLSAELEERWCSGPIVAAHDPSRGASGGRMNLYSACQFHHDEQHRIGIKSFRAKYGLDTIAIGDAIALGHTDGLGIRGLAARFAAWSALTRDELAALAFLRKMNANGIDAVTVGGIVTREALDTLESRGLMRHLDVIEVDGDGWIAGGVETYVDGWEFAGCEPLEGYDLEALLGWVRRWADGRGPSEHDPPGAEDPRDLLATDLADDLHIEDDAAFALLVAAGAFEGWPT